MNLKTKSVKAAVVGAGAVGSLVGGLLADNGYDITLIGRKKHCETVNKNGLKISGARGEFNVKVSCREKLDFCPDIIFLCVKSQDLADACARIKKYTDNAVIVAMQNGVHPDSIIADTLGTSRIISTVIQFNAMYLKEGSVIFGCDGPVIIGDFFGSNNQQLAEVKEILESSFTVIVSRDIAGVRYMKLLINIMANSLGAVSGMTASEYMDYPVFKRICIELLKESAMVYKAAGIRPASIPGFSLKALKLLVFLPKSFGAVLLGKKLGEGGFSHTKPSTLQSLERGRTTETGALNGEICVLAEKNGLKAPFNAEIIRQCKRIEKDSSFLSAGQAEEIFFKRKKG